VDAISFQPSEDAVQIALNDEELGAVVQLIYDALPEIRKQIKATNDTELRAALEHRERVLHLLVDHLIAGMSMPRAA
jgi:hypothetical protein